MDKTKQQLIDNIIEKVGKLPPSGQKAVSFVIDNFDLIKEMCENSCMNVSELDKQQEKAKATDDSTMSALLSAARVFTNGKK